MRSSITGQLSQLPCFSLLRGWIDGIEKQGAFFFYGQGVEIAEAVAAPDADFRVHLEPVRGHQAIIPFGLEDNSV